MIASPFNIRAKKWIAGRKGLFSIIQNQLQPNEKRIWVHVASLGEFEQGRPVIERIKKQWPQLKIVLTFFSPSGYEIRKNYEHADYVFYLPLDTRRNANKFTNLVKPDFAIFVKYEFWHHFLSALKRNQVPVYLISAIFRKQQVFFRPWGRWYRKILGKFAHIFVQDQESQMLLKKFGFLNTTISGDTRFDRVYEIASAAKTFPLIENFTNGHFTVILGSSWKADEEILFDYINKKGGRLKFIIAPHEIHEQNIQRIMANLTISYQRFTSLTPEKTGETDVLIIDTMGMLSSVYQYGKIAYIGGGFGSGIHNVLEAATFGLPVIFGPNYKKYKEALDLVSSGGAFEVNNESEATDTLEKFLTDVAFYEGAGRIAKDYVDKNRGACKTIMEFLDQKHNFGK